MIEKVVFSVFEDDFKESFNADFVSWNEPTNEKCPQCGGILFKKKGKKPTLFCATEGCGYTKTADMDDK